MAKKNERPTVEELHSALQELYVSLNQGYWVATTIEAKDKIHGLAEALFDILTDLNKADMSSGTSEYVAIQKQVKIVNAKLKKLKSDIDEIIHLVQTAVQITQMIDKTISIAARFFK
jgi:hypothetical protein